MQHHPDRSNDPKSKATFLAVTAAYEVIGDKNRRKEYDDRLAIEATIKDRRSQFGGSSDRAYRTPSARVAEIRLDINRLNTLYSRGNYPEAEKLARSIIDRDRRQPVAYAVLGNLARISGNQGEAIRMYGYALQFDPRNQVYQRCYDELVNIQVPATRPAAAPRRQTAKVATRHNSMSGPIFGIGLVLLACMYVYFSKEDPINKDLKFISTWTLGLVAMLFFSGVVMGACMALDGLLDSYASMAKTAIGKLSPTAALALIAIANFWAAVVMYLLVGLKWKTFNVTTSRLIASVVAGTSLLAMASEMSERISGVEVFTWGGNLVYLGALSGWVVTDALRGASG